METSLMGNNFFIPFLKRYNPKNGVQQKKGNRIILIWICIFSFEGFVTFLFVCLFVGMSFFSAAVPVSMCVESLNQNKTK